MSSTKRKMPILLLVIGIVLLVIVLLGAAFISWFGGNPPERLIVSVKSPDSKYTASEYYTDLGATGGNTYIRIKSTFDHSSKGDLIVYDTTANNLLSPSWAGNGLLVVGVHDSENELMTHEKTWHDVRIAYQKRKYPDE